MIEESEQNLQSLNGLESSRSQEKREVVANILKGYEDFTLDITGKIISSNLEAVNITGYEEWEVIGRHFSIFYTPTDKSIEQPELDLTKARIDHRLTFSAWRLKKRNVKFWAQVTFTSIIDDDGHLTGFKMIMKDQTHRLVSTQRVRKFRDEYLNLFNNSFIGIFKFRISDFKVLLINSMASRIIGKEKELYRFNEIFANNSDLESFVSKLKNDKQVRDFEFQVNLKGTETWARIDCRLFVDEGFVEGVICDITESKKQILELRRLNEELDNFIYHASHDLRSPLTTLLGLINLAEFDNQIEIKEYCSMMRERVMYLDELLKDLAAITFNSKSEVCIELMDFADIAQRVISKCQPAFGSVSVSLTLTGSGGIYSDKQRVQKILENLILNALQHPNPTAEQPYLNITVDVRDQNAFITFKDNGRGIRDDQLLHIFGMFYKASSEIRETGLGLYIAKLMIDKISGKIRVKSKIGVGTEFEIELPCLKLERTEGLPEMVSRLP